MSLSKCRDPGCLVLHNPDEQQYIGSIPRNTASKNSSPSYFRRPHKCPICDGKSTVLQDGGLSYALCQACEKGIVWG